jgi:hypothetical protein
VDLKIGSTIICEGVRCRHSVACMSGLLTLSISEGTEVNQCTNRFKAPSQPIPHSPPLGCSHVPSKKPFLSLLAALFARAFLEMSSVSRMVTASRKWE